MKKSPIEIWRQTKNRYLFLGKKGKIMSCTRIVRAPENLAGLIPYWTGVIKFSNGKKTAGQIIALDKKPKKGNRVIGVMRRMRVPDKKGIIEYGVKFKLWEK